MNKLPGIIADIITEGQLSLVKIKVNDDIFSSIIIDTPLSAPYLQYGNKIYLLFKENEVVIAKSFSGHISMQNKFNCIISEIEHGILLSKVIMKYDHFVITSLITTQAAKQLALATGDAVMAMVKTNEISLSQYG